MAPGLGWRAKAGEEGGIEGTRRKDYVWAIVPTSPWVGPMRSRDRRVDTSGRGGACFSGLYLQCSRTCEQGARGARMAGATIHSKTYLDSHRRSARPGSRAAWLGVSCTKVSACVERLGL